MHLHHRVGPALEHARERALRMGRDQDQGWSWGGGGHGTRIAAPQLAGRTVGAPGRAGGSRLRAGRVALTPHRIRYHCSVTVTPASSPSSPAASSWSRPDDAVRQTQLDAMKRRATGLLALAAAVFAGASAFEGQYPWLGYVRATAEASLVGGLADWFAVTALFRHPLGLPIPHTAIVATRKERIGEILGNFVQNHFLSREVIAANLRRVHPAERAAQWLADREHARQVSRQFASGLVKTLDGLPPNELQDLVSQVVRNRVRTFRVAPALGKTLALALGDNRQEELLNATVKLAAEAVRNNRDLIRERVRAETPWWVPPVVDDKIYQKIIAAVERLLQDMVMDPAHPLRTAFDDAIRDFIERLQHSPEVIARAEALKEEWLMGAQTDELARKLWEGIRQAVSEHATGTDGGTGPSPLDSGLASSGLLCCRIPRSSPTSTIC